MDFYFFWGVNSTIFSIKKTLKILTSKKCRGKIIIIIIKSHGWELGSQRALFTLHPT
jgi:hypothetical protein